MKNTLNLLSTTVLTLAFGNVQAFASDATAPVEAPSAPAAAAPQSGGLEEIIVTARRVSENQQKVPLVVTTLNAAALEQQNVNSISDIQFSVPSLQIKPSNLYPSQPEFLIRGQRQVLYTDANVVTYIDGVPVDTIGLTLYDLGSVQALKGPQGTLFGKNSMGGAMVFTTKQPDFTLSGDLTGDYGNYNERKLVGAINVPLIKDVLALRVAGQIERRDGIFKNVNPGQGDLDNRDNNSIRASLLFRPSARFENTLSVSYFKEKVLPIPSEIEVAPVPFSEPGFGGVVSLLTAQAVQYQSQIGGGTALTQGNFIYRQGNPFVTSAFTGLGTTIPGPLNVLDTQATDTKVFGVSDTAKFELNDVLTVKNIFGYRYERAYDFQEPGGNSGIPVNVGPFLNIISGGPYFPNNFTGYFSNNNTNNYSRFERETEELQLIGKLPNLDFIAGGFYSHERHDGTVLSNFIVGPVNLYPLLERYQNFTIKSDSYAAFAQGSYDFASLGARGLKLTAGLRFTEDKRNYGSENFYSNSNSSFQTFATATDPICNEVNGTLNGVTGVNNGSACNITGRHTDKALTWTGSLSYQINPDNLVYFTNRRGYKAGNADPTTRALNFAFFGPERITDYELGLKSQGRLGSVPYRLNVAGFIGKYKQIQTQDILSFCNDQVACSAAQGTYTDLIIFNVGQATIKGVEADGSIKPFRDLTFNVGYAYQVGKYGAGSVVPQPVTAGPVYSGNPIDYAGGTNLSGAGFAGLAHTTINASMVYEPSFVPESFAKPVLSVNYSYRSSTTGLTVQGIYQTPSFAIVGARLAFDNLFESPFSLAFWAENIGNKYYKLACADNLNSIGYVACKWGEPRTYGLSASVKF